MAGLFHRLPLSRKILLGILPLFLLFISVSVVLQNHFQEREMMEQAQASARTYAELIKESLVSMMVNNLEVDSSFLERVNNLHQFDTVHILVNDLHLRDEILTPEREHRVQTRFRTRRPHDDVEQNVLDTGMPAFTRNDDLFRAVVPFNATTVCQKCHAVPVGYTLGATDLHISLARISRAVRGNWERSMVIFLAFIALAVTVATVMFTRLVAMPIDRLVTATRQIGAGNLDPPLPVDQGVVSAGDHSRDELMFLSVKFDEMRQSLKEKIEQLDRVNKSLSERNQEVEVALAKLRQAQEDLVRSERLAVSGRMTAQLSHEINNPIHNIQSLLETSLRKMNGSAGAGSGQARELVGVALEEVNRLAKLTRQMLEFYRGSVVELETHPVDIAELLTELVAANKEPLSRRGISLRIEVPALLPLVQGSRDKLKQVFLNLMINARDAMPEGGAISIVARASEGFVRVEVADTGVGIPPEHLGRIFEAFFTTKKEVSGVGLGLSVSYGIIQQHHGTIEVLSTLGKGATFIVRIPASAERYG